MYIIPNNVITKFEFFPGFGWKELFFTAAGGLIGLASFVLLGLFTQTPLRLVIAIFFPALAFFITKPDQMNQSLVGLMDRFLKWKKSQRKYLYKRMWF